MVVGTSIHVNLRTYNYIYITVGQEKLENMGVPRASEILGLDIDPV